MIHLLFGLVAAYCLAQGALMLKEHPEPLSVSQESPYQDITLKDLQAIHGYMKQVSTARWLTTGFRQAEEKAKKINSIIGYLSVLRQYATGFTKPELYIIPAVKQEIQFKIPQFLVKKEGNAFILAWKDQSSTEHLPPLGARLISCNGQDPMYVYQQNVTSFIHEDQDINGSLLCIEYGNPLTTQISSCQFQHNEKIYDTSLKWKPIEQQNLLNLIKEVYGRINPFMQVLCSPKNALQTYAQKVLLPSKKAYLCTKK